MQGYVNQSIPGAPQLRKGERLMEERGDQRVQVYKDLADYLAKINLSANGKWGYELKTFRARGRGDARRLHGIRPAEQARPAPRRDLDRKEDGLVFVLRPAEDRPRRSHHGRGERIRILISKPDYPTGVLALRSDRDGNLCWATCTRRRSRIRPGEREVPALHAAARGQPFIHAAEHGRAWNSGVDGKVWSQNNGFAGVHRFRPRTGKGETWSPFKDSKEPPQHLRCHLGFAQQRVSSPISASINIGGSMRRPDR